MVEPQHLTPTDRRAYLRGRLLDIKEAYADVEKGFKSSAGLPTADEVDIMLGLVREFADVHHTIDIDLFSSQRKSEQSHQSVLGSLAGLGV